MQPDQSSSQFEAGSGSTDTKRHKEPGISSSWYDAPDLVLWSKTGVRKIGTEKENKKL